jgi:RimJ/RimL family protein N-acetyltransferase
MKSPRAYLIQNSRIGLRLPSSDEDRRIHDLWRDPAVQRNLNFKADAQTFEKWRKEKGSPYKGHDEAGCWLDCSIILLETRQFIGLVSLGSLTSPPELIIFLCPDWRGKGYGTEAVRLAAEYAFTRMNLESIGGGAMTFNQASLRMLEKVGFLRDPERDYTAEDVWQGGKATELSFVLTKERWGSLPKPQRSR